MLTLMMDKGLLSKEESTATFLGLAWMVLRMATQKTIIHEWTLMTVEMMKNGYSSLSSIHMKVIWTLSQVYTSRTYMFCKP